MKNKIKINRVFKHGEYEILKCFDCFGNWNYTLMYKGAFRVQSFDFNRLKAIAINNAPYLAN